MAEGPTLNDLPNDMFSSFIFPLLQHDRRTLLNLALVSRRFKDLAYPFFYKTITVAFRAPTNESHYDKSPGKVRILDSLVLTLNAHPYLSSYILSLSISVFRHSYYTCFHLHSSLLFHSSLLSLTHNLRFLDLSPPPADLSLAASDYPYLNTLKFDFRGVYREEIPIRIELQPKFPNPKLALVARHFFLPRLRNFVIEVLDFLPRELGRVLFPFQLHGTSQIESLELLGSGDMDIGCLPDMLKCIKSLKRFIFEAIVPWEASDMSDPSLTARSLAVALKPFEHELTQVCIAASDAADFMRGSGNAFSVDGVGIERSRGFREYVNLRILAVPEFFLVNGRDLRTSVVVPLSEEEAKESVGRFVDCLPQNVEYLQIQYMHGFLQHKDPHREVRIRRLEELARQKGAKGASFGRLKKVVWWMQMAECSPGVVYGPIEGLVALKEVFDHVGVDFEWVSEPFWEDTPFGDGRFDGDWKLPIPTPPTPEVPINSTRSLSIHYNSIDQTSRFTGQNGFHHLRWRILFPL